MRQKFIMPNRVKSESGKPLILGRKVEYLLFKIPQISLLKEEGKGNYPSKIDSTNAKISSLLEEPFARKWLALA